MGTIHPRLSVSEVCTMPCSFAEELALWDELGVRQVGVLIRKLDQHGHDAALDELRSRDIGTTTVIASRFDLAQPETWDGSRTGFRRAVDVAAELGGAVYTTSGQSDGRSFDQLLDALAAAVEPCVAYAESHGVALALEATPQQDFSFVHTLQEGIVVADRTGMALVADIAHCWMEPDYEDVIRGLGARIAAVQMSDVITTSPDPSFLGRAIPGDGDLPLDRFLQATLDAGYEGCFEIEFRGPRIDSEGHAPATRRAIASTTALLDKVLPVD